MGFVTNQDRLSPAELVARSAEMERKKQRPPRKPMRYAGGKYPRFPWPRTYSVERCRSIHRRFHSQSDLSNGWRQSLVRLRMGLEETCRTHLVRSRTGADFFRVRGFLLPTIERATVPIDCRGLILSHNWR